MPKESAKYQSVSSVQTQQINSNNVEKYSGPSVSSRARKRKRCDRQLGNSDLESELVDCNLEDAIAIENKLRKVAKDNDLSDEEMRRLLQKFVKNEHILALVTLKAEDELARERQEAEQPTIIITDTPSVPKLTRAKARELNKTPGITFSTVTEKKEPAIAALIQDELNSDEDDGEYIFKEEDFASDEDPNTTVSDLDSNPCTPQTPSQTEFEESPVKFTSDGCFKIPLGKSISTREDLRIAARTRSKLCLQQTAIEDIESEFVPPDVEQLDIQDTDLTVIDEDWMQFLNDFTKPLNASFVTDDDDPVNDPEYVAAEKILEDAEELRDINIPKKELTELVAELFEDLINEGISLESVELDTPQKCLQGTSADKDAETAISQSVGEEHIHLSNQLNFNTPQLQEPDGIAIQPHVTEGTSYITQNDYSFHPNVMSTPMADIGHRVQDTPIQVQVPIAYTVSPEDSASQIVTLSAAELLPEPEWIAVKLAGQPNSYQLARVVPQSNTLGHNTPLQPLINAQPEQQTLPQPTHSDIRYDLPYDNNFTCEYISIKRHVYTEYIGKFENLRRLPKNVPQAEEEFDTAVGFTTRQHDILQQQLRIHVQMLVQTFLQTYSHPNYWKLASKAKYMLVELEHRAQEDASFNAWNLQEGVQLVTQWENDLTKDTPENKELMNFIHKEIQLTNRNTRQVLRFPPRVMDLILNSKVFMYPQYLPRIPFTSRPCSYQCFSPAETQLIAMGLEKHMQRIQESGERVSKKTTELKAAVQRLAKDMVFGKTARRIWDHIKTLRKTEYYNPVKYYFEHKRAPPIEHHLHTFENNTVLPPKERYYELPLAWQTYLENKRVSKKQKVAKVSDTAGASYLDFVREALGEDIQLPDSVTEAAKPDCSGTDAASLFTNSRKSSLHNNSRYQPKSVTINVNYHFGGVTAASEVKQPSLVSELALTSTLPTDESTSNATSLDCTPLPSTTPLGGAYPTTTLVAFNYDWATKTLRQSTDLNEGSEQETKRANQCTTARRQLSYGSRCARRYSKATRYLKAGHPNRRHRKSKQTLQKRCVNLINAYHSSLEQKELRFEKAPLVRHVYRYFKSLELYTDLLTELKMACRNATAVNSSGATGNDQLVANSAVIPTAKFFLNGAQNYFGKRTRTQLVQQQVLEEETNAVSRSKKASRQEENFRHMLLPDTAEDANRKDAIYAFNFYEKVEEALKASNRSEDCKIFNHILKSFNPRHDKVADLYYKLERLFLPDHPELAEVFLTFLLPSEAAEIGKFFEHFMINNMTTFINKLNIYFNKQPAQIRKIYNCLAELAEDPDVTIKKVEAKILPLLKGNQFLIDWFVQQFSEAKPPERLFAAPEQVNLKEVEMNPKVYEAINDPLDAAIPCCELQNQQQQGQTPNCQLKYINGRIFYGNKMTLPAKLSFMATNSNTENVMNDGDADELSDQSTPECVHGIREYGEKRLAAAAESAASAIDGNSDDNERPEEEDLSKTLFIDTINDEENSTSPETCDDATLRAHAMRLNPGYYGNSFLAPTTITPNTNNCVTHHPHAKKLMLNFNDDGKLVSPRKQQTLGSTAQCLSPNIATTCSSAPTITTTSSSGNATTGCSSNHNSSSHLQQLRDRRKSPAKKSRSPVGASRARVIGGMQPMVVVYEASSAIACAKKLKTLIEEEENESEIDNKERLSIIACAKYDNEEIQTNESPLLTVTKVEQSDNSDDMEFLAENSELTRTLAPTRFPKLSSHDHHEEIDGRDQVAPDDNFNEDSKLDVVTTLTTTTITKTAATETGATTSVSTKSPQAFTAWTRDEDKLILIEMKLSAGLERERLFERIRAKLPSRSLTEVTGRYQFLMDFLSKLQGK